MRKRAYRSTSVKQITISEVLERLAPGRLTVGLDISKGEVYSVVRDPTGHFERPWKFLNPNEISHFVPLMQQLAHHRELTLAMESTGTYGDALRQALTDGHLMVHRVSGKAVSDYKEIFDGVPSAHDGKDAAIIAELTALGKSTAWPTTKPSQTRSQMAADVLWLDTQQSVLLRWLGRLDSLLARHWPEATRLLQLNSGTLLDVLAHYGSPAALAADPEAAAQLTRWSRGFLKPTRIQAVLAAARHTVGVRLDEPTMDLIRQSARAAQSARAEIRRSRRNLKDLAEKDPVVKAQAEVVGTITACVLRVSVGNPHDYHCGEAYRKGIGLNLKVRSSGKYEGKLRITKRGPALARRWLYFAALRVVQQAPVRAWYEAKKAKDQDRGKGAVVAVMRKLALAAHAVATRGETFSLERLLPGGHRPQVGPVPQSSKADGAPRRWNKKAD